MAWTFVFVTKGTKHAHFQMLLSSWQFVFSCWRMVRSFHVSNKRPACTMKYSEYCVFTCYKTTKDLIALLVPSCRNWLVAHKRLTCSMKYLVFVIKYVYVYVRFICSLMLKLTSCAYEVLWWGHKGNSLNWRPCLLHSTTRDNSTPAGGRL